MIRYFVRTTNDRLFEYNLEYEKLIDLEHKPVKSFIDQLKYISQWDSVLLEDDLILCEDFKNKIENVIKQNPNKIINFFTRPNEWFTTHECMIFSYNQCTYYPKGIGNIIASEMLNIQTNNKSLPYDLLESKALGELGISHIQYRPCLVQHIDNNSLIQGFTLNDRRSPYFIDYLKELNIDYNEAFKVENRKKLKEKLERSFK